MEQLHKQVWQFALAGNPNSGKTSLFNALTGSKQYVGNWPGVTVEKKEGVLIGHPEVKIQDLPGIYSLSPYTSEEVVARDYLMEGGANLIINIVDGTNLERNLYLTSQLLELDIPMVVAVNMLDLVEKRGDEVDWDQLSKQLGCPVVPISAIRETHVDQLVKTALKTAKEAKPTQSYMRFSDKVEGLLSEIEAQEAAALKHVKIPKRWAVVKLFEQDPVLMDRLHLNEGQKQALAQKLAAIEAEEDDDSESILANERYHAIKHWLRDCYRRNEGKATLSDRIDKIVTNRFLALPIFALIMAFIFSFSVSGVGKGLSDWVEGTFFGTWISPAVSKLLEGMGTSEWLQSLVVDGIIGGVSTPLIFLPQMAMVFLCLSLLEECGYMARVAFIMDRLFRRFGLSGKSFISFLVSAGCGVPGILSTRTIENQRDRDMTMITTTMIPCSAKLPVIAVVAGYLIGGAWWVAPAVYLASIAIVILSCLILKKMTAFSGKPAPFVMELPAYHMPSLKNTIIRVWDRLAGFIRRAGTLIFAMAVAMWFLASFGIQDGHLGMVDTECSFLARFGSLIAPIFVPLGFGNWQAVASSFAGFAAKEATVSTMSILAGLGDLEDFDPSMVQAFHSFFPTAMAAISFLFFNLFNSPCVAAIATLRREASSTRIFTLALLFQNFGSYVIALMIYQIGSWITGSQAPSIWLGVAFALLALCLYFLLRPEPKKESKR